MYGGNPLRPHGLVAEKEDRYGEQATGAQNYLYYNQPPRPNFISPRQPVAQTVRQPRPSQSNHMLPANPTANMYTQPIQTTMFVAPNPQQSFIRGSQVITMSGGQQMPVQQQGSYSPYHMQPQQYTISTSQPTQYSIQPNPAYYPVQAGQGFQYYQPMTANSMTPTAAAMQQTQQQQQTTVTTQQSDTMQQQQQQAQNAKTPPPSQPQANQNPYQKREHKGLAIIDVNTGKDISQEIVTTGGKAAKPMQSTHSTLQGTPVGNTPPPVQTIIPTMLVSTGSTGVWINNSNANPDISAQFAAQVAATLNTKSTPNTAPLQTKPEVVLSHQQPKQPKPQQVRSSVQQTQPPTVAGGLAATSQQMPPGQKPHSQAHTSMQNVQTRPQPQPQANQNPYQKRERKGLDIIDVNTGKDISQEIVLTGGKAAKPMQSTHSSLQGTPVGNTPPPLQTTIPTMSVSTRTTDGRSSGSHANPDIAAQFAAQVAATLNMKSTPKTLQTKPEVGLSHQQLQLPKPQQVRSPLQQTQPPTVAGGLAATSQQMPPGQKPHSQDTPPPLQTTIPTLSVSTRQTDDRSSGSHANPDIAAQFAAQVAATLNMKSTPKTLQTKPEVGLSHQQLQLPKPQQVRSPLQQTQPPTVAGGLAATSQKMPPGQKPHSQDTPPPLQTTIPTLSVSTRQTDDRSSGSHANPDIAAQFAAQVAATLNMKSTPKTLQTKPEVGLSHQQLQLPKPQQVRSPLQQTQPPTVAGGLAATSQKMPPGQKPHSQDTPPPLQTTIPTLSVSTRQTDDRSSGSHANPDIAAQFAAQVAATLNMKSTPKTLQTKPEVGLSHQQLQLPKPQQVRSPLQQTQPPTVAGGLAATSQKMQPGQKPHSQDTPPPLQTTIPTLSVSTRQTDDRSSGSHANPDIAAQFAAQVAATLNMKSTPKTLQTKPEVGLSHQQLQLPKPQQVRSPLQQTQPPTVAGGLAATSQKMQPGQKPHSQDTPPPLQTTIPTLSVSTRQTDDRSSGSHANPDIAAQFAAQVAATLNTKSTPKTVPLQTKPEVVLSHQQPKQLKPQQVRSPLQQTQPPTIAGGLAATSQKMQPGQKPHSQAHTSMQNVQTRPQPQPQANQNPYQKRERKGLDIIDVNTGKDISQEIVLTGGKAAKPMQSTHSSLQGTPVGNTPPPLQTTIPTMSVSTRTTDGRSSGSHANPDIAAQFAAQVAATLNMKSTPKTLQTKPEVGLSHQQLQLPKPQQVRSPLQQTQPPTVAGGLAATSQQMPPGQKPHSQDTPPPLQTTIPTLSVSTRQTDDRSSGSHANPDIAAQFAAQVAATLNMKSTPKTLQTKPEVGLSHQQLQLPKPQQVRSPLQQTQPPTVAGGLAANSQQMPPGQKPHSQDTPPPLQTTIPTLSVSTRQTDDRSSGSHANPDIAAQFAAQVAATLNTKSTPNTAPLQTKPEVVLSHQQPKQLKPQQVRSPLQQTQPPTVAGGLAATSQQMPPGQKPHSQDAEQEGPKNEVGSPQEQDLDKKFTSEEKKRLTEMKVLRVLYIGESNAGKTSLAQTILQNKPYVTERKDRTVVADHFLWMPDEAPGSVFCFVDIGGHSSYKVTGHYFHRNSENNLSVFCHDLNSTEYENTFKWIESTINHSLKCEIMFLLTKVDKKNVSSAENIEAKKKDFIQKLELFLEAKISALKESVESAEKHNSSKMAVLQELLVKYEYLRKSFQDKLLETSCYDKKKVRKFQRYLIKVSEKHKVSLDEPLQLLFGQIGTRGIPIIHSHEGSKFKAVNSEVHNKDVKESTDDNNWQAFGCNPEENKYIERKAILPLYKEILESLGRSTENIEQVLNDGLDELDRNGLLIYFGGEGELGQIVFHNLNVFVSLLKCIFNHSNKDLLTKKEKDPEFDDLLKKHYHNKMRIFNQDKDQLYKKGLMSSAMLQFLLGRNGCGLNPKAVRQLLVTLEEAAIPIDDSDESDIFIPYFVGEMESSQSLEQIRYEKDTLVVQYDIEGNNLPITLWHRLLVHVLKKITSKQKREVWRNAMSAHTGISKGKIAIRYNYIDRIKVFMQAEIKDQEGHQHIWDFLGSIQEETDRLMKDWWPGLVTDKFIRCTDLVLGAEPCKYHDLNTETAMLLETDTYCCGDVTDIPMALIRPTGKGAENKLKEARAYINARVEPSKRQPKHEVSLERRVKRLETKILQYEDYTFCLPQIRKHLDKLVEGLVAQEVLDYLFQESILSDEDYEDIKAYDSTPRKQTRMLLCKVDERGQQALQVLISAVREQPQMKHLLKYLEDKTQGARRK